jgi:hypothetical protein
VFLRIVQAQDLAFCRDLASPGLVIFTEVTPARVLLNHPLGHLPDQPQQALITGTAI